MAEIKIAMISSTVRDLPEHREKIRDACLGLNIMPSMMEYWPAHDADGVSASIKRVDEADVYIGVFAHRYGYVPKGQTISVTEKEYDRALERGIPRLIFLIDDTHPITIDQVEVTAQPKVEALRNRLKADKVVAFFKSPEELQAKVTQALAALNVSPNSGNKPQSPAPHGFDPRNAVFFVPFRPKGNQVVGRAGELKAVRDQLLNGHRTVIGQTASFRGLGGLGKTQLAVEYAYTFRDHYPNGVVWLNADQDIEPQLIKIAEAARWIAKEADHKDKLAIAQQRIRTHSHCLIIFDNVEGTEAIRNYLPEPQAEPHILITSRNDHPDFIPVPLDVLTQDLSIKLLSQEAGQPPVEAQEMRAAAGIAEKLGGLPLALELAGAYMRHRSVSWVQYRDLLEQNLKAALPGKLLKGSFTRHEADVYSTLKISDEVLSQETRLREVLDILTWSGASSIGLPLLCALLDCKEESPEVLAALSLGITLRLLQKVPSAKRYSIHRLVREVRREEIPLETRPEWVVERAQRLGGWFQALKRSFSDLQRFEAEIEHLHAWERNVAGVSGQAESRLVWLKAYPPFHRGNFQQSAEYLKSAKELLGRPGVQPDAQLLASILTDLCTINTNLGRYKEAKSCGEQALNTNLELVGEKHPDTALAYHNLAMTLNSQGENQKALEYSQKALAIWQALQPEDSIDTALALDGLSGIHKSMGKPKEAQPLAENALKIREKVLGHLHPETAHSYSNVGSVHAAFGNYSLALDYERKALQIAETLFGQRSPIKANVLKNIAFAYHRKNELKQALQFSLEAFAMRTELFGDHHPDTLRELIDTAAVYFETGQIHKGFQLLDSLATIPKDHPLHQWLKERRRDFAQRYSRPGFRQPKKR